MMFHMLKCCKNMGNHFMSPSFLFLVVIVGAYPDGALFDQGIASLGHVQRCRSPVQLVAEASGPSRVCDPEPGGRCGEPVVRLS